MIKRSHLLILLSFIGWFFSINACKTDVDSDLPYILLAGPNPFYIDSIGGQYVEPGYKGLDDVDGDLTSVIKVTVPVIQTDSAKSYEVIYTLSDRSNNTFSTYRTVIVRNTAFILEGFYPNSLNHCGTDTSITFAATILPSVVSNGQFFIRNFGNLGQSSDVSCFLDQTTGKITIPVPQVLADSSSLDAVLADSTYILRQDTLSFQVYFSSTKNAVTKNCVTVYKK